MRIVAIGAHADDIELGMGGTLAKHSDKGDDTHVVVCTLGNIAEIKKQREEEARNGAAILGIKHFHSLDYSVFKLNNKPSPEFLKMIKNKIEEINPDRIYVHGPHDYHQVHVAVNRDVLKASNDIRQILFFETISSTTPEFKPNAYVDITKYIDARIQSIQAHKSQGHRQYMQPNVIRSLANTRYVWGKVGPSPDGMAEGFVVHRLTI